MLGKSAKYFKGKLVPSLVQVLCPGLTDITASFHLQQSEGRAHHITQKTTKYLLKHCKHFQRQTYFKSHLRELDNHKMAAAIEENL